MITRTPWLMLAFISAWLSITSVHAEPTKRVFLITNRGCEEVCMSFKSNLTNQGPVDFIWRDIDGDASRVPALVAEIRRLHPDLVATWGTGITLGVVGPYDTTEPTRYLTDIPVVYMYVGNPVESKIARSSTRSGRSNVAGANTSVPIDAQINLLTAYRPIKRVGMLYNTNEPAAVFQAAATRRAFEAHKIQVTEVRLPNDSDGRPNISAIPAALDELALAKPDFLFQIGSTFMLQQIKTISTDAIQRGMPMFSATEPAFRRGEVLLGLISPLAGIGQIAAYQAGRILFHHVQPGSMTSPTLTRHSILINMQAARALKFYPPMKLLQFAELTE